MCVQSPRRFLTSLFGILFSVLGTAFFNCFFKSRGMARTFQKLSLPSFLSASRSAGFCRSGGSCRSDRAHNLHNYPYASIQRIRHIVCAFSSSVGNGKSKEKHRSAWSLMLRLHSVVFPHGFERFDWLQI